MAKSKMPRKEYWKVWNDFLRTCFTTEDKVTLRKPMGEWMNLEHREWNTYFDLESECVAVTIENNLWDYHSITRKKGENGRSAKRPTCERNRSL